jgi:multiple sugar transport system substrate-binding protein
MKPVSLRGITWNHSRAFPPLVATAQRFEEQNQNVQIRWERRSLHEFGHGDLSSLSQSFDLLVIDHPMLGDVEQTGNLLDLHPMLPPGALNELTKDATGPCLESYWFHDRLYALPIDAAAPAASCRPDILDAAHLKEPETWAEIIDLARLGYVQMPGFPVDLFLNLVGLCVSCGSSVAADCDRFLERSIALQCLELLRELASLMPDKTYECNPISLYETMAGGNTIAYCPFAYTYSNYSRQGFAPNRLRFSAPVKLSADCPMRTVLGGTGIGISSQCDFPDLALAYCIFVAGTECQSTLYGLAGGQPASLTAWKDPTLNLVTDNFFERTLSSIQTAYVRPRYQGYIRLQEQAGLQIIEYLRHNISATEAINTVEALYRASLKGSTHGS